MRTWILLLGLSGWSWADTTVFSALPQEVRLRLGSGPAQSLEPHQSLRLSSQAGSLPYTLENEQGQVLGSGQLSNHSHWVVHAQGSQIQWTQVGQGLPVEPAREAVGFFNDNPYGVHLSLYSSRSESPLAEVDLAPGQASPAVPLAAGSYKIYLRDVGGNPLGESYSKVSPGRYYLIYRKHTTLYDVEPLGNLP